MELVIKSTHTANLKGKEVAMFLSVNSDGLNIHIDIDEKTGIFYEISHDDLETIEAFISSWRKRYEILEIRG